MSGLSNLAIAVRDFRAPATGLSSIGDRFLYAFHLEAPQGDLDRKKPFSLDDLEFTGLINEEFPDAMSSYYKKVRRSGEMVGGRCLESKDVLRGR